MNFEYTPPQTPLERAFGGNYLIHAFGKIAPGDDEKFAAFLERSSPPPRSHVYIDSTGGDVDAAINIGHLIRSCWFSTDVGSYVLDHTKESDLIAPRERIPGSCCSAATLVFLGGRLRYFEDDSKFGVHQFSFVNADIDGVHHAQIISAKISRYISEMGIPNDFFELSASHPADGMRFIPKEELEKIRVVTGGATDPEWRIQSRNNMIYVRGERDSLFGHHKIILAATPDKKFYIWGIVETQGRNRELQNFPTVEIVLDSEKERIDVSEHCHRSEIGIYTHFLSPITHEVAGKIAFCKSIGLQVRASREAEIFVGVTEMETDSGQDLIRTFYEVIK